MKQVLLFILFNFAIFISSNYAKETYYRINSDELNQLNQLYQQCNGQNWFKKTGWPLPDGEQKDGIEAYGLNFSSTLVESNNEKDIYELTCTSIIMIENNLSGNFPDLKLSHLQNINLENNNLSGTIPEFQSQNLLNIDLHHNKFVGTIPNFKLPRLQYLSLSDNELSGEIPRFISLTLQYLFLNNNNLSGTIPDLDSVPNLQSLYLSDNKLSRLSYVLPAALKILSVNNNQLSGVVPDWYSEALEELYLSNNNLSGSIPGFCYLEHLRCLDLSNNNLSGTIPDFNKNTYLVYLDLSNNKLSGKIPKFELSYLQELNLSGNQLSGVKDVSVLPAVWLVQLSNNKLTFNELEKYYLSLAYTDFEYVNQDTILPLELDNSSNRLTVVTKGQYNVYNWYKHSILYKSTSENYINLSDGENPDSYSCEVINSKLSNLILKTRRAKDSSNGICADNLLNTRITILPIPAIDYENINYHFDYSGTVTAKIYDTGGNLQLTLDGIPPEGTQQINLSNFSNGMYNLVFEFGGRHVSAGSFVVAK